jgi:hypothetical protein
MYKEECKQNMEEIEETEKKNVQKSILKATNKINKWMK